jgi:hypothetical protein
MKIAFDKENNRHGSSWPPSNADIGISAPTATRQAFKRSLPARAHLHTRAPPSGPQRPAVPVGGGLAAKPLDPSRSSPCPSQIKKNNQKRKQQGPLEEVYKQTNKR